MVPNTEVVGTGVQLLYFSLVATLLGVGVASLTSRFLAKRRASEKEPGNWKGWWLLYLLVLLPAAAFLAYNSTYIDAWNDILFLAGFLVFSIGGGILIGHVMVRGTISGSFRGWQLLT